jgi:hypothetical protein
MPEHESPAESYRRKMAWKRTPEENMRLFVELQRQAFEVLKASPEAMEHFLRRNHRKRRQSEVEKILRRHGKDNEPFSR